MLHLVTSINGVFSSMDLTKASVHLTVHQLSKQQTAKSFKICFGNIIAQRVRIYVIIYPAKIPAQTKNPP